MTTTSTLRLNENEHGAEMLKMFISKDPFPAKIWPVISQDIHDNIIGGPAKPAPKTTVAAASGRRHRCFFQLCGHDYPARGPA